MKKLFLIAALYVFVLGACMSTKITSTWKDETTPAQKYNKIMVLGLIRDADRRIQEKMEDHFINDLKDLGYPAVSSLREYGPKAFDNLNEEQALEKIKNSGVDAVITIVLLDKERERYYIPGRMQYSPFEYSYRRFWGYRGILYQRIYEPGYYVTNTKYFWESNLYDISTQKLLYSVQTQSFQPESTEALGHQYGQMIIKQMVKENMLQNQKTQ